MQLTLGAGKLDRAISDAERLLVAYRQDSGLLYLDHKPLTPADSVALEDLAVTALINSRFSLDAARSFVEHAGEINLTRLPPKTLEDTDDADRLVVAELIAQMVGWRGIGTSVATKVLHKKRPGLIPILDNQAIFGAYMNPAWPEHRSSADTIYAVVRIKDALDWIAYDVARDDNADAWTRLSEIEPTRSRIQLFDMVWWMHFRELEPV